MIISKKAIRMVLHSLRKAMACVAYVTIMSCLFSLEANAFNSSFQPDKPDSTFSVESFRQLPTDVSAFIDAVRDLNGEACALLKVVAPGEFAFSSPLGIVKRSDEVGEIWLYLPKGSKSITLKHPQWGVLRDYQFGMKLESRMTYEMRLRLPKEKVVEKHDTIVFTKTVVDTVTIAPTRQVRQLHAYALLTASMHTDGPSWGCFAAIMRQHGVYVHASSNLHSSPETTGSCDREGYRPNFSNMPYYTGKTQTSEYALTIGAIHRLNSRLNVFEGMGYGSQITSWQLADSEGGGWLQNDGLTHKGFAAELGVIVTVGQVNVSASVLTIAGKQWQAGIGVGICLGKTGVLTKLRKNKNIAKSKVANNE